VPVSQGTDSNHAVNKVTEYANIGTPMRITAQATDPGDTESYSLTYDGGGLFAIEPNTDAVTANGVIVEAATSHKITVKATSSDTSTSSASLSITAANFIAPDNNLLQNGGGEFVPSIGWTVVSGDWQQRSDSPATNDESAYFFADVSEVGEFFQDVDVGYLASDINAGRVQFQLSGQVSGWNSDDTARVIIEYRDSDGRVLDSYNTSPQTSTKSWQLIGDARTAPPGTTVVRVRPIAVRTAGANSDGYFDALVLKVSVDGMASPTLPPLLIAGFLSNPLDGTSEENSNQAGEAILLVNTTDNVLSLDNYAITDFEPGVTSQAVFPAGAMLGPHGRLWVARDAAVFYRDMGFSPDYENGALDGDPDVPNLDISLNQLSLDHTGDEVAITIAGDPTNVVDLVLISAGDSYDNAAALINSNWSGAGVEPYIPPTMGTQGTLEMRKIVDKQFVDTDTAGDWISETVTDTYPVLGRRTFRTGWLVDAYLDGPLKVTVPSTFSAYFSPDTAFEGIRDLIQSAQESILLKTYLFDSQNIADLLIERLQAGVSVTVLMDFRDEVSRSAKDTPLNQRARHVAEQLTNAGGQFFYLRDPGSTRVSRFYLMHEKSIIVDGERVLWGSGNYTLSSLPADNKLDGTTFSNREGWAMTDAPPIVSFLTNVFNHDLSGYDVFEYPAGPEGPEEFRWLPGMYTASSGRPPGTYEIRHPVPLEVQGDIGYEVVLGPENVLMQGRGNLGLVNRAGIGDVILAQVSLTSTWDGEFTLNTRLQSYVEAARRGARVRILIDSYDTVINRNLPVYNYLLGIIATEDVDLEVQIGLAGTRRLHNKLILAEINGEKFASIGSLNEDELAYKLTRELQIIVKSDAVYTYHRNMFDLDWACNADPAACVAPAQPDADLDGVQDPDDNCPWNANSSQLDTDNDAAGNACDNDDDGDGLNDTDEVTAGTDPLNPDSDFDTYLDGEEVAAGSDPMDPESVPPTADGDLNDDGEVDGADVLIAARIIFGFITATPVQQLHMDVAPLVGGVPMSDGALNTADLLLIQRKAVGQIDF